MQALGLCSFHLAMPSMGLLFAATLSVSKSSKGPFMSKKSPVLNLFIASAMALSATTASANSENSEEIKIESEQFQAEAAKITLDQVVNEAKRNGSLINKLENKISELCAPLDRSKENDPRKREIISRKFLDKYEKYNTQDNKLLRELSRYKLKISLGDLDGLIDTKYFFGGANYQYVVEPAFRDNEQMRKDIWEFRVGVRTPTQLVASSNATIRFTFSRFYGGKDAKWNAIKACPYFLTQTPMNTNEVKTKLRDGDGFRFEVIGTTSLGSEKFSDSGIDGVINVGAKTEALFLMDLYKLSNERVRTRLLGVKNKGELSLGFTVKNASPLDFIKGKLRDALTLGFSFLIRKSFSLFSLAEKYPLDTMMVDYLYKFSSPNTLDLGAIKGNREISEAAVEELFANIRHFGFSSLFFSMPGKDQKRDEELGTKLLDKIGITRDLAKSELERYRKGEVEAKDMKVRSLFVGRMQSDLASGEGRIWFSELFTKKGQVGNLDSFVTSYDENIQPHYYYLNNTFQRSQTRKFFGRERYNYSHDFDILILSDRDRKLGQISDIVLRTEVQDTDLTAEEIKDIKSDLVRTLPADLKNNPEFHAFFPTTDQTNAFISHRYVFGHEAFKSISQVSKNQIGQMLYEFIENHPEKSYMHTLPSNNSNYSGGDGTYAEQKAFELSAILNPEFTPEELRRNPNISNEKSLKAFEIANRDPIFDKYIVGEFFSSILPHDSTQKLFGLNLKLTSREAGNPPELNIGGKTVSPVYEAVSFLRAVISDPSLDMQMIGSRDNSGAGDIIPVHGATPLPSRDIPKN